jgi:hypothetical protein
MKEDIASTLEESIFRNSFETEDWIFRSFRVREEEKLRLRTKFLLPKFASLLNRLNKLLTTMIFYLFFLFLN